jgi:endonuclease YncB( thermonuclease family)
MNKTVTLTYNSDGQWKDQYNRLLAYDTIDGKDVNAEMVRQGWAVAETRFKTDRLDEYIQRWRKAQAGRMGMWSQ